MSVKKKGLGRTLNDLGLSGLLSDIAKVDTQNISIAAPSADGTAVATMPGMAPFAQVAITENASQPAVSNLRKLPIDMLRPGKYQPRNGIDKASLEELADSIKSQGIIQPIVARPVGPHSYEIITGERRWRAAQLANLEEVPVIIRELTDNQALAMSLIENIQREDLNAIDTALGLKRLIDEFTMTHQDAATIVGKSRVSVTNLLRLLELDEEVKNMLKRNEIEMGHARALLALTPQLQIKAAKTIIAQKLSVRETEKLVNALQNPKAAGANIKLDPNIVELQKSLKNKLGANVDIKHSPASGKGRLIIHYHSLDALDGILKRIK
jgi:ParB family transcriptional regulator, chromosome partitioning protein